MDLTGIGPILTAIGTGGGVWGILLLFRWFMRDFNEVARRELAEARLRIDGLERDLEAERRLRWHAEDVAAVYRQTLAANGIPIPREETSP